MRFYLLLLCASLSSLQATKEFYPLSYTMSLIRNTVTNIGTGRTLSLMINGSEVGQVNYTIGLPSSVNLLHVNQPYRNHKGYGKLLLYSALRDIVQCEGAPIELQRQPLDLSYNDDFAARDRQLKKLYEAFGFKEMGPGSPYMELKKPSLLTAIDVVPQFSNDEVSFTLKPRTRGRAQPVRRKNAR